MKRFNKLAIIVISFGLITSCNLQSKSKRIVEETKVDDIPVEVVLENPVFKTIEDNSIHVERFKFPLPEQYRYCISSNQGLRGSFSLHESATLSIYHNAIDFVVPIRTPVYAAKSGYIINCYPGYDNGSQWKGHDTYGGLIEIQHDDKTRTMYAHLIRTDVKEGQYVKQGELIGASGGKPKMRASGVSTGPHLHFAIYLNILDSFEE